MPQQYLINALIERASCLRFHAAAFTPPAYPATKSEIGMRKAMLVGAFALAMVGPLSFSPQGFGITPAAAQEVVVTEGQIARLHAALHLTASQERHWHPVAATLRHIGRTQQEYRVASNDAGFVERTRSRVSGYTVTAMAMQRL